MHYNNKDIDCDIRENIINYEDEGGGEGDQTGYDLSVLRYIYYLSHGIYCCAFCIVHKFLCVTCYVSC